MRNMIKVSRKRNQFGLHIGIQILETHLPRLKWPPEENIKLRDVYIPGAEINFSHLRAQDETWSPSFSAIAQQ